MSADLKNMLF